MKARDGTPAVLPSPGRLFLTVLAILVVAEVAVTFLGIPVLHRRLGTFAAFIADDAALILLSAPFLWWFVMRPLRRTALREHAYAATVLAHAADGIITLNEQGLVMSFNVAAERVFGYEAEEMAGKPLTLLMPGRYRDAHRRALEEVWATGKAGLTGKTLELHGLRKDGTEVPLELSLATWKVRAGTYHTAIVHDITERKRAEEALRENETRLRELFDEAPVGYHELDSAGRIMRINRTEMALLGYTAEEMLGRPVWEFILERESSQQTVKSKLAGGELAPAYQRTYLRKDGTRVPVLIEDRLLRDPEGRVTGLRSTIQDISVRKQAEEAAREHRQILEAVLETTRALNVLTDSDGRIHLFNRACEELTGRRRQDVIGQPIADCFQDQTWVSIALKLLADPDTPELLVPHECPWQMASGGQRVIEWRFRAFPSPRDGRPCVLAWGIDVTTRKRAEEALRESEALLSATFENLPCDFWARDQDGRIVLQNSRCVKQWGDQIGKHPEEAGIDEQTLAVWRENNRRASAGEVVQREVEYTHGTERRYFHTVVAPLRIGDEIQGILGFNIDITDRKRAEEALRESEERFRVLTESIPHLIWSARADGTSNYYNRRFLNYLGKTQEDMQGWTWATTLHPDDRQRSIAAWTEALGRGTEYQIEYRIRRAADGEYRWHFGQAVPLRDVTGKILRWFGTCTDIHDRKLAEEALRQSEARFSTVFHASPVAITITRLSDNRCVDVNKAWQDMMGFTREEAIGRTPSELEGWVNPGAREWLIGKLHTQGTVRGFHCQLRQKSGTVSDMLMSAELIELAGEPCMLSMAHDITERKRAEEALLVRTKQLEAVRATSVEITRELSLATVLDLITRRSMELAGGVSAAVYLWDEAAQVLAPHTWHGYGEWMADVRLKLGEGITGTVAQLAQGMIVNEYRTSLYAISPFVDRGGITATLAEPLLHGDRLVGVITINNEGTGRPFTDEDREALSLFASQAAIAIQNARLYAATERRATELATLREIGQAITAQLDLPTVLETLVEGAMQLLGSQFAHLAVWDETSHNFRYGAAQGPEAERTRYQTFVLGRGSVGTVALTRQHLILDDYQSSPYALPEFPDVVATITVPILFGNRLLGVLHSHTTQLGKAFTPDDLRRFQMLADQAAVAIENARLFTAEQERRQQLEAVRAVTSEITRELELNTLLGRIVRYAAALVRGGGGSLYLWDEASHVLVPRAWQGHEDWVADVRLRLGEAVAGVVAQRREGMIVNDYQTSPYAYPLFLQRAKIAADLAQPLLYHDRLIGVIEVFREEIGQPFSENDLTTLSLFATQAAIAIENARLFQAVSDNRGELRALTSRLAETEEGHRKELARELHDSVGQNLTALNLNLNIIRTQLPTEGAGKTLARLDDAMRLVEETTRHIRGVMTELRPPALDDYGLLAALRWYGRQFSARSGLATVVQGEELTPRLPLTVEMALFRIAQEGLTNVVKHARASQVTVTIEAVAGGGRLTISDDGEGFDPRILASREIRLGWGLLSMRERAAAVGGRLRVEAAPGMGTRIVVDVAR